MLRQRVEMGIRLSVVLLIRRRINQLLVGHRPAELPDAARELAALFAHY